ncbi:hypothetical protein C2S51_010429 [Perilla frutescens var. frutescens]|nr:hypothetical protein C2S51_010429 [Perilla frutescens var. frutescens]
MRNIRDVVYEVEDVIDAFVTQAIEKKAKNFAQRVLTSPVDLHSFGEQIKEVKKKVEDARIEYANHKVDDQGKSEKHKVRPPREKGVVGFEDETEKLIRRLNEETDDIDVISLIGMLGLGKTTLAWKVFNEPEFFHKFPVRIWLSISQDFSDKDIFISILKEFINIDEDIRQRNEQELARIAADYLEKGYHAKLHA